MTDTQPDLVVQISASDVAPDMSTDRNGRSAGDRLIAELRRCLRPGVEIALVFDGYMAITSILWLSELQPNGNVRAGVRLLGVSAVPGKMPESNSTWESMACAPDSLQLASAIVRQHS